MRKFIIRRSRFSSISFALLLVVGLSVTTLRFVSAADNADLTQTIGASPLLTDIRDASRVSVANPTFAMSSTNLSIDCQSSNGSLGSNTQRMYVDNPDAADSGWTLTIAATNGPTAQWENGDASESFDFNDATDSGCTDGADTDSNAGQMSLDPSAATLTTDCGSCSTTSITKGSASSFSEGSTDSVTLLNAAAGSDDVGRWYLTGINVDQTIPDSQPVDSYDINLTVTVTAS